MNASNLLFKIVLALVTLAKIAAKNESDYLRIFPFNDYYLNLSEKSEFLFKYQSNNEQANKLSLHFLTPESGNFSSFFVSVFQDYKSIKTGTNLQSKHLQKTTLTKEGKIELNHADSGSYYIIIENKNKTNKNLHPIFISDGMDIIEGNFTVMISGYSSEKELCYKFERAPKERVEVLLNGKESESDIRIRIVDLQTKEIISQETGKDFSILVDEYIPNKNTYAIYISSNSGTPEEKKANLTFSYTFITINEYQGRAELNITRNTTFYYIFQIDSNQPYYTENILRVFGKNLKGKYKSAKRICGMTAVLKGAARDFDSVFGAFIPNLRCIFSPESESRDETVLDYFISFIPQHYYPDHFVIYMLFINTVGIEEKIDTPDMIYYELPPSFPVEQSLQAPFWKMTVEGYNSMVLLSKITLPSDFEGSLFVYSPDHFKFMIFVDSIIISFKENEIISSRGPLSFQPNGPGEKASWLYLLILPDVGDFHSSVYFRTTKETFTYVPLLKEINNYHFEINSCAKPHYFVFSNEGALYKNFIYNTTVTQSTEKVYLKKNITIIDDLQIDIFPTDDDIIAKGEVYSSTNYVFMVACDHPFGLQFSFTLQNKALLNANGKYLLHLSEQSNEAAEVEVDYKTEKGGNFSIYQSSKAKGNLSVEFNQEKFIIENEHAQNFKNTKLAKYLLESSSDTLVSMTVSPDLDLFYDLNKNLKWISEDESESLPIKEKNLIFKFPRRTEWTFLEVEVNITKEFNSSLVFKNLENESFTFEPIYQETVANRNGSAQRIIFKNAYFEKIIPNNVQLFFVLSSNYAYFTEIKLKFGHDLSQYGRLVSSFNKSEPVFDDSLKTSFIIDDIISSSEVKKVYFLARKCQKEQSIFLTYNNLFESVAKEKFELSDSYSIFSFSDPRYVQIGFDDSNSVAPKTYTGVFFSYIPDPSEKDLELIKKYTTYTPQKINFNYKEKKVSWNPLENFSYEVYIKPDKGKELDFDNDCYLMSLKKLNSSDVKIIAVEGNEYSLEGTEEEEEYFINVVAVRASPVPVRLLYESRTISLKKSVVFEDYPSKEKTEIALDSPIIYIILKNEPWDFLELEISDPGYQYYFSIKTSDNKDFLSPPSGEKLKKDIKDGDHVVLSSPYTLNPISSPQFYYLAIIFTKEKVKYHPPTKLCDLSFKVVNRTIEAKPAEIDSKGMITFTDFKEMKATNYLLSKGIKKNERNRITLIVKTCDPVVEITLKVLASSVPMHDEKLTTSFKKFHFTTYTDLVMSFESEATDADAFCEATVYFGINLTGREVTAIKEILNTDADPFYSYNYRGFTWQRGTNADFYDAFIFPYTEEYSKKSKNECYLLSIRKNPPEDVIYVNGKDPYTRFDRIGTFILAVISSFNEPIPIRVLLQNFIYEISAFNVLDKNQYEANISAANRNILIILSQKFDWDYLKIQIANPQNSFYSSIGFANSTKEVEVLPEDGEKKTKDFLIVLPNYNKMKNKPEGASIFYYNIHFDNEVKYDVVNFFLSFSTSKEEAKSNLRTRNNRTYYVYTNNTVENFIIEEEITSIYVKNITLAIRKCTPEKKELLIKTGQINLKRKELDTTNYEVCNFETYTSIKGVVSSYSESEKSSHYIMSYAANLTEEAKEKVEFFAKNYTSDLPALSFKNGILSWEGNPDFEEYAVYSLQGNISSITDCELLSGESQYQLTKNSNLKVGTIRGQFSFVVVGIIKEPVEMRFMYPVYNTTVSRAKIAIIIAVTISLLVFIILIVCISCFCIKRKNTDIGDSRVISLLDKPLN